MILQLHFLFSEVPAALAALAVSTENGLGGRASFLAVLIDQQSVNSLCALSTLGLNSDTEVNDFCLLET